MVGQCPGDGRKLLPVRDVSPTAPTRLPAGFSCELLEYIAAGGGKQGRRWEFAVGWSCTEREIEAIERVPRQARQPAIDQNGDVLEDTFAAVAGYRRIAGWKRFRFAPDNSPGRVRSDYGSVSSGRVFFFVRQGLIQRPDGAFQRGEIVVDSGLQDRMSGVEVAMYEVISQAGNLPPGNGRLSGKYDLR